MSFHQPFNQPSATSVSIAAGPNGGWRAVHVLSATCGCSARVMRHLAERGPLPGVSEQVVLVDAPHDYTPARDLARRGFSIRESGAENLTGAYGVRGVPLLEFVSPDGRVAWRGGYGAGAYRDAEVWSRLRSGQAPPTLAVYGCAVGERLKRRSDPFSLKYALISSLRFR